MLADLYNIYQLKPSSVMEMCIKFATNWIQHSVSRYGVLIYCILIPAILLLPFISVLACQLKLVKKPLTFLYLLTPLFFKRIFFTNYTQICRRTGGWKATWPSEMIPLVWQYEVTDRKTEQCGLMPPVHFSERKECLILTYCRRNVSEGRVIGIYIGRIMGGREHSVVVDSDSWTMTTERKNKHWFPPMWTHDRRHSEGKTTGGMWCAGMRQSDAELSARRRHWLSDATHHSHVYTWSLYMITL